MKTFAVQYLEDGPGIAEIGPDDARARLRAALERLPISPATVLSGPAQGSGPARKSSPARDSKLLKADHSPPPAAVFPKPLKADHSPPPAAVLPELLKADHSPPPAAVLPKPLKADHSPPPAAVLLGWNLAPAVVDACREEATRAGAQLFRWHPLLTGDGTFVPRPEWQTVGLDGEPVPGLGGMPEFTFVCPNRPAVREAVRRHLVDALQGNDYDGVFLDRIRYPSPAADPACLLACFCDDCRRIAAAEGLNLEDVRRRIQALLATPERTLALVRTLLDPLPPEAPDPDLMALHAFLDFRARSVTRFVQAATDLIHAAGLAVGLDCFSPALASLVGQDLGALDGHCEWVKIMTYGHALGPAGLPFELLGLANWLVGARPGLAAVASESEALEWLSLATRLPLPRTRAALRERGLAPEALAAETRRGRAAGVHPLFAGIELVEIDGLAQLDQRQIEADLRAFRDAGADGLVLSWDVWHIPLERLDLVRAIWEEVD